MTQKKVSKRESSSFRDPSGHVYYKDGKVFRQINLSFKDNLDLLISSGLLKHLSSQGLLVKHTKVNNTKLPDNVLSIFQAENIPFISYPYEWSFSQLKDAALLTLEIQKKSIEFGMSLKDASSYNIQFLNGKPIFIDFLSFEKYTEGKPWVAYEQFCKMFLGPLLLMSKVDFQVSKLMRTYIDGIPLDVVSKLLPKKTYFSFSIATHIHLHAKNQTKYSDSKKLAKTQNISVSKFALLGIIDSLKGLINGLDYKSNTEWGDYYTFTNYSDGAFDTKRDLVENFINKVKPKKVLDIGANNGEFSRVASEKGIFTVSSDIDPVAVEKNYLRAKEKAEKNILPLVIDLANPSPSIGWNNDERISFKKRSDADVVLSLALIHHLAISNNLPFSHIANFMKDLGKSLIIEFVPKEDSQVQKLLVTREDIFDQYNQKNFEKVFSKYFKIVGKESISQSQRTLYLMKVL